MKVRELLSVAAAAAAWTVLVIAPQAGYLVQRSADLPWSRLLLPNLALALLLTSLTLLHLRSLSKVRVADAAAVWGPWLVAALAAAAASPVARRAVVPVALVGAAAWLLPPGGRAWSVARGRGPATAAVAFAATAALAAAPAEGSPGLGLGIAWGIYLVLAMVGWGGLALRLAQRPQRPDWALRGGLGLAATVAFGGLLNLLWSVSPAVLLGWLAVGFGAWVADLELPVKPWRALAARPAAAVALAVLATLAMVQLGASLGATVDTMVDTPAFDLHDDLQAYLVFPTKMLSAGSIGAEPFEPRRMLSLGGQSFLQTLVLVALPLRALHLLDAGVCLLLLVGLAWGAARAAGLGPGVAGFVAAVALVLPHPLMRGNTSSVLTGAVVLLTLLRLVRERWAPLDDRGGPPLVALAASAACALKSTLIPAALTVAAFAVWGELARGAERRRVLAGAAVAAAVAAAALLPWMISVNESSGTLLYPILGRGFDGAVWSDGYAGLAGRIAPSPEDWIRAWLEPLAGLLPIWLLLALAGGRRWPGAAAAAGAAVLATVAALTLAGDPTLSRSFSRYLFPVEAAVLLFLLVAALARLHDSREGAVAAAAAAAVAALAMAPDARLTWERTVDSLVVAVAGGDAVSSWDRRVAEEVSRARPPGPMLATLRTPFLLDRGRGSVATMSLPGMASPPPGLRLDRSPSEVAEQLRARGFRTLAYAGMGDLSSILTLTEARIVNHYPRSRTRWVMLRCHQRYREIVRELAGSTKRVYDDGSTIVLDLASRVITLTPEDRRQAPGEFLDGVWSGQRATLRAPAGARDVAAVVVRTRGWHPDLDRAGLRVEADGRSLEPASRFGDALLYLAEPPLERVDELVLRVEPPAAGREPLPGWVEALGVDVQAVELAGDPALAGVPIRCTRQPVADGLEPAMAPIRTGFFADFGWTGARAEMRGFSWPVAGRTELILSLHPVHPWRPDWGRARVRLFANSVELRQVGSEGDSLVFGLPPGLREIHRLRIEARTFVPREVVGAPDDRSLGVPVRRFSLR